MRWRRGINLTLGMIGDMREVSWMLDRHPDRVKTDRDRALREEGRGSALAYRLQGLRQAKNGDAAGAVESYEQLLAERIRAWGEDHPLVLGTRFTLAGLRGEAGDPAAAARAFEQLLADIRPLLGEEHPYTRRARRNLAYWGGENRELRLRRKAEAALPAERMLSEKGTVVLRRLVRWRCHEGLETGVICDDLLAGMGRALGHDHPYVRRVHRIMNPFWTQEVRVPPRRWRTASDRGLPTERLLRKEHAITGAFQRLAHSRRACGDAAGAVTAAEQLLTRRVRALGKEHPLVLFTRLYLAGLRGEAGDADGAAESLEQLLTDLLRVLGEDHPFVLFTRLSLAGWLGDGGEDGWSSGDQSRRVAP